HSTQVEREVIIPFCKQLLDERPTRAAEPDRARLDRLRAAASRLAQGPPATLAQLKAPDTAAPATASELLDAVYANPDDDGARRVYADWLLAQGDPRGEFIVTQLSLKRSPANLKREQAVLKQHATQWLGPLEPVVERKTMRFERGFLAAAAPQFRTAAQLES